VVILDYAFGYNALHEARWITVSDDERVRTVAPNIAPEGESGNIFSA
jgi:hypothetical protein